MDQLHHQAALQKPNDLIVPSVSEQYVLHKVSGVVATRIGAVRIRSLEFV